MNPNERPDDGDQPLVIGEDGKPVAAALDSVADGWGPVDGATVKEFGIFEAVRPTDADGRTVLIPRQQVDDLEQMGLLQAATGQDGKLHQSCSHDTNGDGNCGRRSCPQCGGLIPRQQVRDDLEQMGLGTAVDLAIKRVISMTHLRKVVMQALARGYCTPANCGKVVDPVMQALLRIRLNQAIDLVNASGMKVAAEGMEILPRQLIPDEWRDKWFVLERDAVIGPFDTRDAAVARWEARKHVGAVVQGVIVEMCWKETLAKAVRMSHVEEVHPLRGGVTEEKSG